MCMIPYASAIGLIIHAVLCIIPNISYALRVMSRCEFDQGDGHRVTIKDILYCLRRTKEIFLIKGDGDLKVRYQILI